MTLNKDLYERYLAKKAKKLGVSVESLRGASSQTTDSQPTEQSQSENVVQASESNVEQQQVQQVNTYVQPTYPQQTYSQPVSQQTLYYQPSQTVNRVVEPTIIDRRENKFAVIGFPLGHSLSSVIHTVGFKSM